MKYVVLLIFVIASFAISRLLLSLASPNDSEGTNLLITTVVAIVIFVALLLVYRLIFKKSKAKS